MKIQLKSFKKPQIKVIVKEGEKHLWKIFHPHHYMTADKPFKESFPSAATFYTFYWVIDNEEILIGCSGVIFQISKVQKSRRLTRVVVLPEFQGMGFGSLIVNNISEFYTNLGFKVYSATYHPRLGEYRENSNLWEGSHYNLREFKLNDDIHNKGMSGLRDGLKMYRHSYKKEEKNKILFNPLEVNFILKQVKDIEEHLTIDNEEEYNELFKKYKEVAEKSLQFIMNITFERDEYFSPIGQDGWYFRNGKRAYFDQQPEDAASAVDSLVVAHLITRKKIYKDKAKLALQWFLGKNHLRQMVYDEATGGCFDGLGKYSLNFNQGAESTVSYLLARLAIEKIP